MVRSGIVYKKKPKKADKIIIGNFRQKLRKSCGGFSSEI
jgi:hypothetical protein